MKRRSSTTAKVDVGEIAELRAIVERLVDHVGCLTAAVDDLTDQVKWRNNNDGAAEDLVASPFVLTSMPRDPAAREFPVNRVPQETIEQLRDELPQSPADVARTPIAQRSSPQSVNPQQSLFD